MLRSWLQTGALSDSLCIAGRRAFTASAATARERVYLHQTPSKGISAVSFLERPPNSDSVTTIGYTKSLNIDELTPNDLQESQDWMPLVHAILGGKFERSVVLQTLAKNRGDGYIHIQDERNMPDANRIGDPSDIIASVLVQESKLVPGSYEGMPAYRTLTGDGIMQLNDELHNLLLEGLEQARALEAEDQE